MNMKSAYYLWAISLTYLPSVSETWHMSTQTTNAQWFGLSHLGLSCPFQRFSPGLIGQTVATSIDISLLRGARPKCCHLGLNTHIPCVAHNDAPSGCGSQGNHDMDLLWHKTVWSWSLRDCTQFFHVLALNFSQLLT